MLRDLLQFPGSVYYRCILAGWDGRDALQSIVSGLLASLSLAFGASRGGLISFPALNRFWHSLASAINK